MKIPKTKTSEFLEELIIEKSDVPVPRVMKKSIEVVKLIPQEQAQNRTVRQITDVPAPRVMEENAEVEMLKVSFKLDGGCAAQAPKCEELQRLRDEEFLAIHDTNKLMDDSDSLELFKQTCCLIDDDTSLATDMKSHVSTISDPTEQQQHWHNNQQQSTQQAMQQQLGERGREGEPGEEREKEKERKPEVKKDVTDWIVVTRNRRQRKMIQIFVRINGSKATPMDVNLTDDKVEGRDKANPERRGCVCDNARKSAEERRKAEELRSC